MSNSVSTFVNIEIWVSEFVYKAQMFMDENLRSWGARVRYFLLLYAISNISGQVQELLKGSKGQKRSRKDLGRART